VRKLAIFALVLLIVATIVITLGATNYAGFGDTVGSAMQTSFIMPMRNWVVSTWLVIGSSGWYILAAILTISVVGGLFMVAIVYGLFWQKLIQGKVLHKTTQPKILGYQHAPTPSLPQTTSEEAVVPPKVEEPQKQEAPPQ